MVRYSEGPSVEVEVEVAAPPEDVWPLLCDINLASRFSEEFQGAEWTSDGGPVLGATFRGNNRHPQVGEWSMPCTVTAFEPVSVFEWTVGDVADKTARWRLEHTADSE